MQVKHFDYKIGDWHINISACLISTSAKEVYIEPKAMQVLQVLIRANGDLVTRDAIMEEVWAGRYVTEYALNNTIATLRKHLDPLNKNTYILTRPKRGYQLICDITQKPIDCDSNAVLNNTKVPTRSIHSIKKVKQANTRYIFFIAATLALIAVLMLYFYKFEPHNETALQTSNTLIAVLPFHYAEQSPEVSYFAQGFAAELIEQMQSLKGIRVLDRRSTFGLSDKKREPQYISGSLGAKYIINGKVASEKTGELDLTVDLFDEFGNKVWTHDYAVDSKNVLSVQDHITQNVIKLIDTNIPIEITGKHYYRSQNPEAFMQLLKGRAQNGVGTLQAYQQAIVHFKLAIELDDAYTMAYVDLATNYMLLYGSNHLTLEDANAAAKPMLEKALALNPNMPSAIAAKAIFAMYNNDNIKAMEYFNKALALNPNLYVARHNLAYLYKRNGELELSLKHFLLAKKLAPLSTNTNWAIGSLLLDLGRIDDAQQQLRNCALFVTSYYVCHLELAYIQRMAGEHLLADNTFAQVLNMATNQEDFYIKTNKAFHAWWTGNIGLALQYYDDLFEQEGVNFAYLQSYALLQWQLSKQAMFLRTLKARIPLSEATHKQLKTLGLLAYAIKDCEQSLFYYEQAISTPHAALSDFSEFSQGLSDTLNMAACYTKLGKSESAMIYVEEIVKTLNSGDKASESFEGIKFLRNKAIAIAAQNNKKIDVLFQKIDPSYPYYWMLSRDWALLDDNKLSY